MDWIQNAPNWLNPILEKGFLTVVGYLVVGTFLVLIVPISRAFIRQLQKLAIFFRSRSRALNAVARSGSGRDLYEGDGPWATIPVQQPDNYETNIRAAKVLAVANYKGGVGKTTFAANIAACLAKEEGKRILLIDLDFQGSLSAMACAKLDWQPGPKQPSVACRAISGDIPASLLTQVAKTVWKAEGNGQKGRVDIVTSHYDVANADVRLLVEWLLKPRQRRTLNLREKIGSYFLGKTFKSFDLRYVLADLLHDRRVQNAYDLIVIDCPPRLTSGTIQAFAASSHIIIPTLLDETSADSVVRFSGLLNSLKTKNICPHLRQIGIVPNKVRNVGSAQAGLQRLQDEHRRDKLSTEVVPEECYIPLATSILDAQRRGIAYLYLGDGEDVRKVKDAIKQCAQFVIQKVGID